GASHAGVGVALQLRKEGWAGGITLVSAEDSLPYHRPPLTKDYLAGRKNGEQILLRPAKIYHDNNIELRLGSRVESIDCAACTLLLDDGSSLGYESLALCTGSRERHLPLAEGIAAAHYIRSLSQVDALRTSLRKGGRVLIIGGGYIGLEAAAVLCQAGQQVTVIEAQQRVLQRVAGEQLAEYLTSLHEANGVRIMTSVTVSDITEADGVVSVSTKSGEQLQAELLIIGIGVQANSELAAAAGIKTDNGIVVDSYTRTSAEQVYAAGDCTRHPSKVYDRQIRLESVQNANDQARVAAANMAGRKQAYVALPWFWSDQYQVKLQMAGLNTGYDQVVLRGNPERTRDEGFALFYLNKGRLLAAECINRPQEFMASKALIVAKATPDPAALKNPGISLKDLAD
ncbi:MAG: FAD-dependent oxidoreductase, partial [Gammaproteobacteria bacterium]